MSLTIFACTVILWNVAITETSGYFLSGKSISWLDAADTRAHKFVIPKVSSLSTYLDLLKDEEEVWVGYFQRNAAFAYVGCTSTNGQPSITLSSVHENSPGLCFALCSRIKTTQRFVGLSQGKCFCLSDLPGGNIHQPGCDLLCTNWIAGDGAKLMSLYEKKDIVGLETSGGKCLAFSKDNNGTWQSCNQSHKSVCKTKNGTYKKLNINGDWHLSWERYIRQCFSQNCYPITYEDIQNISPKLYDLATNLTWTRLIQSFVLYEYNEEEKKNFNMTEFHSTTNTVYGYLKSHKGNVTLHFTKDGNELKRAVFQSSDVIVLSSQKISSVTTTSSSLAYPHRNSTSSKRLLSLSTTTTDSFPRDVGQINKMSDVGISVGISVTAFVIVIAAVVVIATLRRRGKIKTECLRKEESKYPRDSSIVIHSSNRNVLEAYPYDEIGELDFPTKQCNEKDDRENKGYCHINLIEEPAIESDIDGNIKCILKSETYNVYNKLSPNRNVNEKCGENDKSENTYDITKKFTAQSGRNVREQSNKDAYDHTGIRPSTSNKSNIIYSSPTSAEVEYEVVGIKKE